MSMMTQHSYKTKARYYDELKEHVTFWMNSLTVTSFVLFLILLVWLLPGPYTFLLLASPIPATLGYAYFMARRRELLDLERELRHARTYQE